MITTSYTQDYSQADNFVVSPACPLGLGILSLPRVMEEVIKFIKSEDITMLASGQVFNTEKLRSELAEIRIKGFSVTVGERVVGNTAISSPLLGYDNEVLGAIAIGGPTFRFNEELATSYGTLLSTTARKISDQLHDVMIVDSG